MPPALHPTRHPLPTTTPSAPHQTLLLPRQTRQAARTRPPKMPLLTLPIQPLDMPTLFWTRPRLLWGWPQTRPTRVQRPPAMLPGPHLTRRRPPTRTPRAPRQTLLLLRQTRRAARTRPPRMPPPVLLALPTSRRSLHRPLHQALPLTPSSVLRTPLLPARSRRRVFGTRRSMLWGWVPTRPHRGEMPLPVPPLMPPTRLLQLTTLPRGLQQTPPMPRLLRAAMHTTPPRGPPLTLPTPLLVRHRRARAPPQVQASMPQILLLQPTTRRPRQLRTPRTWRRGRGGPPPTRAARLGRLPPTLPTWPTTRRPRRPRTHGTPLPARRAQGPSRRAPPPPRLGRPPGMLRTQHSVGRNRPGTLPPPTRRAARRLPRSMPRLVWTLVAAPDRL
mmetsp:Transcript_3159/g.9116  ORF Transcript_3159/g.9116 Transcript_3159/m.9116 type:complete len:388 (-) Transcript_3159:180-1343(-)